MLFTISASWLKSLPWHRSNVSFYLSYLMLKIEYLKTVYLKSEDCKYAFVLGALYFTRRYGIFGKNLRNVKRCEKTLLRYSEYLGIYALMASRHHWTWIFVLRSITAVHSPTRLTRHFSENQIIYQNVIRPLELMQKYIFLWKLPEKHSIEYENTWFRDKYYHIFMMIQ